MIRITLLLLVTAFSFSSAKSLWSTSPATNYSNVIREAYLLGNGRLGVMPFGAPGAEKLIVNVDSLWSGGPFSVSNYTGGNPTEPKYEALPGIRSSIFQNATGEMSALLGSGANYGSYQVLGNLSVLHSITPKAGTFKRSLDLKTGIYTTSFTSDDGAEYKTEIFCNYPDSVCIYQLNSTSTLPDVSVKIENQLVDAQVVNSTCGNGYAQLQGVTQIGPPLGMKYMSIARTIGSRMNNTKCTNGTLIIPSQPNVRSISIIFGAGTDYDQTKGNAANDYSFRGDDPSPYVQSVTKAAGSKSYEELKQAHLDDYSKLMETFTLELPDPQNSASTETSVLFNQYDSSKGDPFVEALLFDYSRHLLISSSRQNSLPANLQGRWSEGLTAAWSADYHANINIQMNYWAAEQTGLGEIQEGLWKYMRDTWVPRGTETAKLLYGAPGWVVHNEVNVFGHTAMKENAHWTNDPAAAAWMMQHVSDHFSYTQDTTWLKGTGYPLLKGVAQFWLSQLQEDLFWNDNTFVVNPCNSPEQDPTTFGCTHYQQILHQLLGSVQSLGPLASESDSDFLTNVTAMIDKLDKGLHFTSWDGIAEWKLPKDLEDKYDFENNTHRHLSHLWGWYPGISLSSPSPPYLSGYTNSTIQAAVSTSLYSRGNGNGQDANAGWAKVWRAACWARLNNTERAYFELKYAVEQNFVGNALSMYSGENPPFQIDANFGFSGAVLSMLVVDIEEPRVGKRNVILGPAIPSAWESGSVKGLRLRGGGSVNFEWDGEGLVKSVRADARNVVFLDRNGKVIAET